MIAGVPAKIIGIRFSLDPILQHEKLLYKEEERLDLSYLQTLFTNEYSGLKITGTDTISQEDLAFLASTKAKLKIGS